MFPMVSFPSEIVLQIIQKMNPISYVRLRQTCKSLDDFCETKRHRLQIYPRKLSIIYLTASLMHFEEMLGKCHENDESMEEEDDDIYVVVNYGRMAWDSTLKLKMAEENIPVLHRAISGFNFHEVVLWTFSDEIPYSEKYHKAFEYFMKATNGIKPFVLKSELPTVEPILEIAKKWKLKTLSFDNDVSANEIKEMLTSPSMKNIVDIMCNLTNCRGPLNLLDLLQNKEGGDIALKQEQAEKAIPILVQKWRSGHLQLKNLELEFEVNDDYHEKDLTQMKSLLNNERSFYLGRHPIWDPQCMDDFVLDSSDWNSIDYWLFQLQDNQYGLVSYEREKWSTTLVRLQKLDEPADLIEYVFSCIFIAIPIDLSGLFQEISQLNNPMAIRETVKNMLLYYEKMYESHEELLDSSESEYSPLDDSF